MEDREATLKDYVEVMLKWKKLILGITVVS